MSESGSRSGHIRGFDGLRGLAALAVFFVHFNQVVELDSQLGPFDLYYLLTNGKHGVALFFILSGLLLSLPFWRAICANESWPNLKIYTVRRLARILPVYYLALTVLIVVTGLWHFPNGWIDIALHYSFLFNYTEFSIFSINAPFWTLAVELQFYLILPLLFLGLCRLAVWQIIVILLLLGILAWALNYWLVISVTQIIHWPGSPWLVWVRPYGAMLTRSLLAHLPHFLIGVVAGYLLLHLQSRPANLLSKHRWRAEVLFWACLITVMLLLSMPAGDVVQVPYGRYGLPLIPLLLGMLVLSTPFTYFACRVLDSNPLRRLGLISYSFYIFHLPCLNLIDRQMVEYGLDAPEYWLIFGVVGLALSLAVAILSYLLVERPVLRVVHSRMR